MSRLKGLAARTRSLFNARASESRMEEEFSFHVEMETNRLIAQGLVPREARRRALITFGGLDQHREAMRDGRGARWLNDLTTDLRYALRQMRHSPGFALAVALTLGVGIGVNGLVFGYVNTLLFRPIAGRDPGQLVAVFNVDKKSGQVYELGYDDYRDLRDKSGAFDGIAGMAGIPVNLVVPGAGSGAADMVWGEMVTENFFSVLGMQPTIGRLFTAADAPQGANAFAVLSHDSWVRRFRRDSSVVGKVVRINGTEFVITGVAARGFKGMRTFGFWPEVWVPAGMHDVLMPGVTNVLSGRAGGWVMAFARMHRGWDRDRTGRAASLFAAQLEREYPATNANAGLMLIPATVGFDHPGFVKPRVLVLASSMGIFAGVVTLLIICANLANLQLARAAARAREIAIRLSVGCSRARLTRQLLVESLVLAIPGMLIAWLMVQASLPIEARMVPHLQFRVGMNAQPDHRVALFTAAVSLAAVALFGLIPALRAGRPDLVPSLAKGALKGGSARQSRRLRGILVVSQLAMSVVLLVGGTLFVRSLVVARAMDLGFDSSNRLLVSVNIGLQSYDAARGRKFYDEVVARARGLPSVQSVAWAFPVPFDTYGRSMGLYVEGIKTKSADGTVGTEVSFVSEDFISALGLRLHAGRTFSTTDSGGAPLTMLVSRSLATRLWPGKDPIGQRVRRGNASGPEMEVVGVVGDAKFVGIGEVSRARAYMSVRQLYRDWETLVVHTRGDPASVLPSIQKIVSALDATLPTFGPMTMEESVESGLATSRTAANIAGFFGTLALLIAAVGLYAVVAAGVAERTREIGVRLALGSTPSGVMRLVMKSGARLGIAGLAIGLVAAIFVAKSMANLLYGLSSSDPVTFALVPLVLAFVVTVATYLPARKAVRLDPVTALRAD